MRVIIPPTGNETIAMVKDTSLLAFLPLSTELFFQTSAIGNRTLKIMPTIVAATKTRCDSKVRIDEDFGITHSTLDRTCGFFAQRDGRGVVVGGDEAQLTFPLGVARELPVRQEGAGDGERDGHGDVAGPPQRGATVHDATPLS